jgi:adenine-specific DNA-methyltransferase
MYPRLKLARNLLKDDGVIFISIANQEIDNLIKVCNEIFGEDNFIGNLIWRKKEGGGMADDYFSTEHEYILVFQKSRNFQWNDEIVDANEKDFNKEDERGKYTLVKLAKWGNTARREDRPSMYFSIVDPDGNNNFPIAPDGSDGRWRVGKDKINYLLENNLIEFVKRDENWIPYEKIYFDPLKGKSIKLRSILYDVGGTAKGTNQLTELFTKKDIFENPKPIELFSSFGKFNTQVNDIILDFFSGSATTAHAVMKLNSEDDGNRKFICVQLPETTDETNCRKWFYENRMGAG